MADIFISYSSKDRDAALSLVEKLRSAGYDVWIDQHQLNAATRWSKEIVQAINGCKIFAVLLSPSSLKSENVRKELSLAGERHKQLLPIFIEKVALPDEFAYHLTGLQRVFIENTDAIVTAIGVMHSGAKPHDRLANQRSPLSTTPDEGGIRLAVLPFDDLSPAKDNEWFADGMVDELINTLGALDTMKVPSRTDVMYYKKHHPKVQEIASDLNVHYLVGGSVRKAGDKIRITASLTNALANQLLWTSNFDGTFDDVFVFQETVAKQIADALNLKLSPQEVKTIADQPTQNPEAYELYLRGLESHGLLTRSGYEKAMSYCKKALEYDPTFVDAYLVLASTSVSYYRECQRDEQWLKQAERCVEKVESITGKTAKTLLIRGEVAWQHYEFLEAETYLKGAIDIDPDDDLVHSFLGNLYSQENRFAEAADHFAKSLALSKRPVTYFNLLVCLSELADKEYLKGKAEDAILLFESELKKYPRSLDLRLMLAYAYFWSEEKGLAEKELNDITEQEHTGGLMLFNSGGLYKLLGKPEENLRMIEKAIAYGFRQIDALKNCTFEEEHHTTRLQEITRELEHIITLEKST